MKKIKIIQELLIALEYFNKDTFYMNSKVKFHKTCRPDRDPDYTSASGSEYWYTSEGVYRSSTHWSGQYGCDNIASCWWELDIYTDDPYSHNIGYAKWTDFTLNRDISKDFKPVLEYLMKLVHEVKIASIPR